MERIVLLVMVAGLGCGGGSSRPKTAPEKCDDLLSALCDRVVSCIGGGTHSECVQGLQSGIPCGSATMVSASYDRCLDQVNHNSCDILFPSDGMGGRDVVLPADCSRVISTASPRTEIANRVLAGAGALARTAEVAAPQSAEPEGDPE